jgi:hypothetical protein
VESKQILPTGRRKTTPLAAGRGVSISFFLFNKMQDNNSGGKLKFLNYYYYVYFAMLLIIHCTIPGVKQLF